MKPDLSNSARRTSVLAGALFGALGAYSFVHDGKDWPQALLWAAIGVVFLFFGVTRRPRGR